MDTNKKEPQTTMEQNKETSAGAAPRVNVHVLTWLLACCSMIGPFATDMYLPSFQELMEVFDADLAAVQQTLTAYLAGFAAMTLFYGTISDVIGRRPTMIGGFILFSLSSLGASFAPTLGWLVVFRFLEGLFAGCGMVVGMAVIRDLYGGVQAQRLMAYVAMVFGFGPALAPVLGGYFSTHFGWASNFHALTAISAGLAAACFFLLPESLPKQARTPVNLAVLVRGYARTASHVPFMIGNCALGIAFLGQGVFIAGAADWCVNVMQLRSDEFWMLFLPMIGGTVAGSWISTRLAEQLGTTATMRVGFAVMLAAAMVSMVLLGLHGQVGLPWAVMPLSAYTVGLGIVRPGMALVLMDFFPGTRGLASSIQNFVQTLFFAACSAFVVPLVYGEAWRYEAALIVFGIGCILLWALAMHLKLERRDPARETRL